MLTLARYLEMVREAAAAIGPWVVRTPLVHSRSFSDRFGFPVYLKLENFQVTGAFKIRGAMNKVLGLKRAGVEHVVAASSGSHAMGVALAARTCGIRATIVMPATSPKLKRGKVRSYGAELIVEGATFDDAYRAATGLASQTGAVFVSGIEDELVMAGHGTMALEILEDLPKLDFVAIPVGGGGAISGLLMALKEGDRPVQVWGVQSSGSPSMKVSIEKGEVVELPAISTVADAIAVRKPGRKAFELVRELADGVVTVDDEEIVRAAGRLGLWDKVVAEPAAAAGLAVNWSRLLPTKPRAAAVVVTGGNATREFLIKALNQAE